MTPLLIVFCKNPELGKVKTRLSKDIGPENALKVYKKLLEHTAACVAEIKVRTGVFYHESLIKKDVWEQIATDKKVQSTGDLGARMAAAFRWGFQLGLCPIVLIGSDLWSLTSVDIQKAFKALIISDFVLGPAQDGGYYLLGMKKFEPCLFEKMPWSTPQLLAQTLALLENKKTAILEEKNDIDVLEDLKKVPELMALINRP